MRGGDTNAPYYRHRMADEASLEELRGRLAALGDPLELLASLFAHSPVPFQVYRADGVSALTNPAFRRLFGSEPPPEYSVLRDEIAARTGVLDLIHRAFQGETVRLPATWYDPRELEQVRVETGNRVAIEATFVPLIGPHDDVRLVAVIFNDVTAEITALEQAQAERDRLSQALEAGRMGTWAWDPTTGVVAWSQEAEVLFGVAPGSFTGRFDEYAHLLHPDDREQVLAAIQGPGAAGEEFSVEHRVVWPDGSVHWLNGRGRGYVDETGRLVRMAGTVQDVTERRDALAKMEAAVRARDEFLSIASHELRTPIASLKGAVQILERDLARGTLADARLQRMLTIVGTSTDRLTAMVDDLLDVARLQTGQLPVRPRTVDLAPIVGAVVRRVQESSPRHAFRTSGLAEPVVIQADPDRLDQVFGNLLENAVKYSPGGGEIAVSLVRQDDRVEVAVRDNGIGLPPGASDTIFEPFGRASNAASSQIPGLGLGLYVCRQIVERHGGQIWAESIGEGQGTMVTVSLPATTIGTDPPTLAQE